MSSLPPNVKVESILIPSAIVFRLTTRKFEIDEQTKNQFHLMVKAKVNQEYKGKYSKLIYYCWIQKSKVMLVTSSSRRTRP
jgi:hypothetical protein